MLSNPQGGAFAVALLGFVILGFAWLNAVAWYERQLLENQRSAVSVDLSLRANALSAALNRRIDLIEAMHAFVQSQHANENFQEAFEIFATDLYTNTPGIENLAVAPNGVIYYVYPVDGNLQVIGYNPLEDLRTDVRIDVQRAIDSREIVLSGPLELTQGGVGLIVRQAVYIDGAYWGLVNVVADFDPILERAGLSSATAMNMVVTNENGVIIAGSSEVLAAQPVTRPVPFLAGEWQLAGVPLGGWEVSVRRPLRVFQLGSFTVSLLLSLLIYLTINRQSRLARSVRHRTLEISKINALLQEDIVKRRQTEDELREREAQYRGIFETVRDGLLIATLDGDVVDFNPSACAMHGYPPESFGKMHLFDFLADPGDANILSRGLERIRQGEDFKARLTHVHADGNPLRVALAGTQIQYQGAPHVLMVVSDISEQVLAYQMLEKRVDERTAELSYMLALSKTLSGALEAEALLPIVFDQLREIADYSGAFVAALDGDDLRVLAVRGDLPEHIAVGMLIPYRQWRVVLEVIESRRPASANLTRRELYGLAQDAPGGGDPVAWVGVPLVLKGRVTGVLHVEHSLPDRYQDQSLALFAAIADMIALALENARLYEQAQALASLHERQRLARDLHDSVSQALYGIVLGARTARGLLSQAEPDKAALNEAIDYLLSLADAGLAEMRALIFELRPETLETDGLVAALERQAVALRSRHDVQVETDFCEEPLMPLKTKEIVYRIFREAIHNTVKHAGATRVLLSLWCSDECLQMEVRDNGSGFSLQEQYPGHLGIQSMRERVTQLGGEISIESAPGQGTLVRAQIPFQKENSPAVG